MGKTKIEKCSCPESLHLREALRKIIHFAEGDTGLGHVEDLAQINNLAHQGLDLEPLVGDPGIGKVPK